MCSSPSEREAELGAKLAALDNADLEPLRAEWLRLYRGPSPPRLSRDLLARGIATKLQEAAHGGLLPAMRRKLVLLAQTDEAGGRSKPDAAIQPKPGATLVRTWQGQTHTVQVLNEGFEYRAERHRSLSQIAKLITGAHWSGPRFFGLNQSSSASSPTKRQKAP